MSSTDDNGLSRRDFVHGAVSTAVLAATPALVIAAGASTDKSAVLAQIPKQHADNIKRLQDWIALPSIAAENRNYPQGAEYMAKLATDAGLTGVKIIPTSGKPGVFARLDAGAKTTLAVYFMYDVKQFVPEEWSSPPLEARLVEKQGLGTVCMGRGAVNQKGPQNAFLGALAAFKASGKKLPVNLMLVCEGEEEIGSPHFGEIVNSPEVLPQPQIMRGRRVAWCFAERRRKRRSGSRREGHSRARTGLERRKVGARPEERHPFEPGGASGLSVVASGAGAEHAW